MKRMVDLVLELFAFGRLISPASADDKSFVMVSAQGNPYFGDHLAASDKRLNLRLRTYEVGMDRGFSEGLRTEKPDVYRRYAEVQRRKHARLLSSARRATAAL